MEIILESLAQEWHNLLRLVPRLGIAIIVLILFVWIGKLLAGAVVRVIEKGEFSPIHKKFFHTLTAWIIGLIGFILALNLLGLRGFAASILAGGGMTAIIIGFAFREIGENLLAGVMLAFNRPFEVGDLIQSEDLQGVVQGIAIRNTHIRTHDGRDIFIPSSQIVNRPLINFTRDGLLRPSFTIGIDYADDSEQARRILLEVVKKTEGVLETPGPSVIISSLSPQYLEMEAFFWVDTFQKGISSPQIRTNAMEGARRAFLEAGFTLSSNVSTNVEVTGREPIDLRINKQ